MSQGRHATPVKLAKKEREELLSLIERKTATQRDVMRARIALWAHEGHPNTVIARELRVSVQTVCSWRKRIAPRGTVRWACARLSVAAVRHASRKKRDCS
jgi:transposase